MLGSATPTPVDGVKGMRCPHGSYCPSGTPVPLPCLTGTFNNQTGLEHDHQCTPCSPGMFCQSDNLTIPTGPCAERHFCSGGAKIANPTSGTGGVCTKGHYCPLQTSSPIPCKVSEVFLSKEGF